MSQLLVEVVEIGKFEKNPNSDTLMVTEVLGHPVQFKEGDFVTGDLAVYIPVDAMVPIVRPEFSFLASKSTPREYERIRARKLRSVFSMGFLVPVPKRSPAGFLERLLGTPWYKVGDNLAEVLGVKKYQDPDDESSDQPVRNRFVRMYYKWKWRLFGARSNREEFGERDPGSFPHYDVESVRKYQHHFIYGERVVLTEKIHGCNGRWGWHKGQFYVGSHGRFRKEDDVSPSNVWGQIAKRFHLKEILKDYPEIAIYGEVYGKVQDLKYDLPGDVSLRIFDVFDMAKRRWFSHDEIENFAFMLGLLTVPVLYKGPWEGLETHAPLAEGQSKLGGCIREGWVARPVQERSSLRDGRIVFKLVGQGYLLRKGPTSEKH
jgi:hypothetical protein